MKTEARLFFDHNFKFKSIKAPLWKGVLQNYPNCNSNYFCEKYTFILEQSKSNKLIFEQFSEQNSSDFFELTSL